MAIAKPAPKTVSKTAPIAPAAQAVVAAKPVRPTKAAQAPAAVSAEAGKPIAAVEVAAVETAAVATEVVAVKPARPVSAKPAAKTPAAPSVVVKKAAPVAPLKSKENMMSTQTLTPEAIAKGIETQMAAVAPAMEKATHEAMAQAKASYETFNSKMRETMETSMKSMTEVNEFAKGNIEALMASAKAATAGAEMLAAKAAETSKKSFEETSLAIKSMTAAKTPNEYMQMQNDFAKAQFDHAVATWSHMSETMLKLAGEVVQPLSSRMAVAAETMKSAVNTK